VTRKPTYQELEQRIKVLEKAAVEAKSLQAALQESEANYRQLFENAPAAIYRVDFTNGKILKANDVFCEYAGCSREDLPSFNAYDMLTEASKELFLKRWGKIVLGEEVQQTVEYEIVDKNGKQRCILLFNKNICDSEGHIIASDVVAHDITERKRAELKLQQTLNSLKKAVGTTIQVLMSALESKDPYTAGHQSRAAHLACAIAEEMGLSSDQIDGIRMAGSIHDIGKISIPAEILTKPTKLTKIEFSLIQEHAQTGYEMLRDVESPWPLAQIVYQHHERMDGSGYPNHLKGNEILMEDRIMAVADVVEAMAYHRPYRAALGIEAAFAEIRKNRGVLYDAAVVDSCLRLFREKGYRLEENNVRKSNLKITDT